MNRYSEFPPTRLLNRYLVCNWEHTFEGDCSHSHKILPDGCVDIILIGDSPPLVVGADTRARIASFYGPTRIVGIRLTPGIAGAVLHESVQRIVDQEVPLEDLWGSRSPKFRDHASHEEKKKLLESIVLCRLLAPDERVMDAVRRLSVNPNQRTEELAAQYNLTPRHFLRLFETHVGYGPKMLARIFRLQRTFSLAASSPIAFSELALAAAYSDQSHMCREFCSLCLERPACVIPGRASTLSMSDLFKTPRFPVGSLAS
jgi:AraC-like DNA-binding protein